jgi:aminoglycoside/choline kinase family phosphotransferase
LNLTASVVDRLPELFRAHVAQVPEVAVEKLPGDASNRSYYRLRGGVHSAIAMVLADADPHKAAEEINKDSNAITELPFTNVLRFMAARGLPVPKMLFDGQKEGVLLLEDLGDLTLFEHAKPLDEAAREAIYAQAVDQLIPFQRSGADSAADFIGYRRRFDVDLLYWEFHHFLEYGIEKKGIAVAADDKAALDKTFRALSERIASMSEVLVHRDYHSRNLMVCENGKLAIIDFQDALMGPAPYDLASLLRDSYIAVGEGALDRLVERYRVAAGEAGIGQWSTDEFREWFDLVSVQRNLKAAGRFDYIDMVKGNPKFLADIPRTLGYVRGNLQKHASLAGLRLLAKYVPALA